ncbi:unnamed protein product [Caenorhabditis brenneri]
MLYDFVSLGQIFIFTVITVHLVILCKKKKADQPVSSNVTPPVPIPAESKTESFSASSPCNAVAATLPTPANGGSPKVSKQNSVKTSKSTAPEKVDAREKEKRPEKSLNAAFNERLKEDQSAGISETV